ncbi:hypothetical protein [uncultured Phenylobacterium sp.]|uniref:hypothetical protein n=1 Tax=uncultured Phenylobacterium sp. TaxID=349273 RepID=UPI0025EDF7AF|nr:hypothetical protein [uncultured Phenylobacterium sp.]
MPQVSYTVDFIEGVWKVGLNGKHFGPYSSLETAVAAASKAAHKAEAQGYEATLTINTLPDERAETAGAERGRDAA